MQFGLRILVQDATTVMAKKRETATVLRFLLLDTISFSGYITVCFQKIVHTYSEELAMKNSIHILKCL